MKKIFLFISLAAGLAARAQVTVVSANLIAYNVTPVSICQVTLSDPQGDQDVILDAAVYNSSGEALLEVRTMPVHVHMGQNVIQSQSVMIATATYSASPQGNFLQAQKQLPSGVFRHCVRVLHAGGESDDEFCEEVESDDNSFLSLVSPFDKDTIESKTPVLTWTHSEPFNLLSPGESFKLVLVEQKTDQTPEAAVLANQPYYQFFNLLRHDVQYPFDAPALKEGMSYAWQVQKLSGDGTVINKTEAWQFTILKPVVQKENKYCVLKKTLDAGYYTAGNNKIFFRFDEPYSGNKLKCAIYDEAHHRINPQTDNEKKKDGDQPAVNVKSNGYNLFEIDLDPLGLKPGFYFLEVYTEKNEKYTLKFYVE
ncbi:MAG TPA: hypothetical protein VFU15_06045 [Bacteroidia bacterium]|nr:hypothetical protein [Bacteroidia bacterium]